jgi:hypothetical protein
VHEVEASHDTPKHSQQVVHELHRLASNTTPAHTHDLYHIDTTIARGLITIDRNNE